MYKELLSGAAIALTFILFVPYIRSIQSGNIKPHVFTWSVWGFGTLIVFFAQLASHAGIGAWPVGISGAITFYIALLAYLNRGDTLITKKDWAFFFMALSALPFWFLTSDPLWAIIILTLADLLGFGPTVRRAYNRPHNESIVFFTLAAVRNVLVILALEYYSLATVLFPAAVGLACLLLSFMLAYRRHSLIDGSENSSFTTNEGNA